MEEADLMDDNHRLLEKLRLYEGSYLKRAAALLFHPDPEKYVTGAFVKIGFFREGEIEAWGRGIERIITACKNDGFSTPEFRYDTSGIWTTFKFEYPERATTPNDQNTTQVSFTIFPAFKSLAC